MGLAIDVYKAFYVKDKEYKCKEDETFFTIKDDMLKQVQESPISELISKRTNIYLDWDNSIVANKKRYHRWYTEAIGEVVHVFYDTQHELYNLYNDSKNNNCLMLTKEDDELLIKYGFRKHKGLKCIESIYEPLTKFLKKQIGIYLPESKIPKKEKEEYVLYGKEKGYQSNGLNKQFYEDFRDGKVGYFVFTSDELVRYKKEYCTETYISYKNASDKVGIEEYESDRFQSNILDRFIEGTDFVTFDW